MKIQNSLLILPILILFSCDKDEPTASGEPGEIFLVSANIGTEGGKIIAENLTIHISAGAFEQSENIVINKKERLAIDYENLSPIGPTYIIENFPQIHAPITIEIKYDTNLVLSDYGAFIFMEEIILFEDGSEKLHGHPLFDTEVDQTKKIATVIIGPNADVMINPGFSRRQYSARKKLSNVNQKFNLNFTLTNTQSLFSNLLSTDGKFRVIYHSSYASSGYGNKIIQYLLESKQKIENLGFSFNERTDWPFKVIIRTKIDDEGIRDAEFRKSRFGGINSSWIDVKTNVSDLQLKAAMGHELFHLAQMCYDAWGYWRTSYKYIWITEASSVWFEALIMNDPDYVSEVFRNNRNFIWDPLEKEDQNHGYGASSFLRHLTDKYGDVFMLSIYKQIKLQEGKLSPALGTEAIESALLMLNPQKEIEDEFCGFTFKYISGSTSHKTWPLPEPDNFNVITITPDSEIDVEPSIFDLSADSYYFTVPATVTIPQGSKLKISLPGEGKPIRGKVYYRSQTTDPWHVKGNISDNVNSNTCQFFNYSMNERFVNVILVNDYGSFPYQNEFTTNLHVKISKQDNINFDNYSHCSITWSVDGTYKNQNGEERSGIWLKSFGIDGKFAGNKFDETIEYHDAYWRKYTKKEIEVIIDPTNYNVISFDVVSIEHDSSFSKSYIDSISGSNIPFHSQLPGDWIEFSIEGLETGNHVSQFKSRVEDLFIGDEWEELIKINCVDPQSRIVIRVD